MCKTYFYLSTKLSTEEKAKYFREHRQFMSNCFAASYMALGFGIAIILTAALINSLINGGMN